MSDLTKHERLNFSLISARKTLKDFALENNTNASFVIKVANGEKTSKRIMDAIDKLIKTESASIKEKL